MANQETRLLFNPAIPYSADAVLLQGLVIGLVGPYEYTGWRDETMAWKETAYLGTNLNPTPTFRVKGPEALKFLSDHFVNGFGRFPVGQAKHGIMCTEEGMMMMDGVILRTGEDEFYAYWLSPYIDYVFMQKKYDATGENITGKVFLYQIAGPQSLAILEEASGDCLHDVKFLTHRMSKIAGHDVRVLRLGMAGTLAYEVHGYIEHAHDVYNAIWGVGQPLGMRRLGSRAYMMNHTEDGFPQAYYHFPYAWATDPGFSDFVAKVGAPPGGILPGTRLVGSMDRIPELLYRTPVDLGWAEVIKFDHDFAGRKALEKMVANPRRKMVTLEWNKEDIFDVYKSQFEPGEPYKDMDATNDFFFPATFHTDKVVNEKGEFVGLSSGRSISYNYRTMISLCSIDMAYSALGMEVTVVWGEPGTRQKKIRAVVSRFPFLNENRNDKVDVSAIPCRAKKE
jgi:glycine cleavage system aminomethyltransferase T